MFGLGSINLQGASDDSDLVLVTTIIRPGSPASHLSRRQPGEDANEGRCRGGVGDTHLSGDEDVSPLPDGFQPGLNADLKGLDSLVEAHRRPLRNVISAAAHTPLADRGVYLVTSTDVSDPQLRTHLARQHADRRPTSRHIDHLLGGDLLRIRGNTLRPYPVITGKQPDNRMTRHRHWHLPVHSGQTNRQILQQPQRPLGLGE